MNEYPWEFKKQIYPRRAPFTALLQDIFWIKRLWYRLEAAPFSCKPKPYSPFCKENI